ncbi:PAS domain-containing sensor histidine kinase [Clostridium omnivorum]|uniref:histidine kinase n=1 Tax=Clostridium omnivorum TaxID=1604902 RepID=A0ABQ5NCA7_9CLOT|nr:PAS domain-containing sensor histidine kinase [Clostridium sp. E14]GLC32822.1 hypothetical protein bsdE14_42320 [Clostridium sp. E14]
MESYKLQGNNNMQSEQEIIQNKQKELYETILNNIQEGIVVTNSNGNVISMNTSALRMHGFSCFEDYKHSRIYNKEDIECRTLDGALIPYSEYAISRARQGEQFSNYEMWVLNKSKNLKWIGSYNCNQIFNSDGTNKMSIITIRDVTEQKKQDEKILKMEREKNEALEKSMEMKDDFLSLISHEFRTPINVINSAIQAMEYICIDELTDNVKKYLSMIKLNILRQQRLVNNILDITRANAGRIKINKRNIDIVFLTKAIVESVNTFALQKGINVIFTTKVEKKIMGIDDEKYERILLNLLSNAIKFSEKDKFIYVNLQSIKEYICIEVEDNGIGIPHDKQNIIFERFGQVDSSLSRQAEGTGIGLSLVKKLVEALGGSITVKSEVGKGSTFTILIPSEKVIEEQNDQGKLDLLDSHLVHITKVEFSDIYLE